MAHAGKGEDGAPMAAEVAGAEDEASPRALVTTLVDYAAAHGIVEAGDRIWAFNTLMAALGEPADGGPVTKFSRRLSSNGRSTPPQGQGELTKISRRILSAGLDARLPRIESCDVAFDLDRSLAALVELAKENGTAPVTGDGDEGVAAWLMGLIMPRPSELARRFEELRSQDPQAATSWFRRLSGDVDYIKRGAIARNIRWSAQTRWGALEVTINLSKPEKDPRAIARAAEGTPSPTTRPYPACALCMSNEGYAGRPADGPAGAHAARQNLRIVPLELGGERWGLQYSPYAYFDEHCIAMSEEHRPMRVDRACFERLLDFLDLFPHYFIGSNADLPIVGGSILSHEHFQGGRHMMPMEAACMERQLQIAGFPQVEASTLVWPLSVLRLRSDDRGALAACAGRVLEAWRAHDDAAAGIVSRDADGQHSTITPIARMRDGAYELDLVLRCNVADAERPLGRFHPGPELWHLKRENIGLIEVMGLAILPPRLQRELAAVGEELLGGHDFEGNALAAPHAAWARGILERRAGEIAPETVEGILKQEAGEEFARVLEACGVFAWDDAGRAAQGRFLAELAR